MDPQLWRRYCSISAGGLSPLVQGHAGSERGHQVGWLYNSSLGQLYTLGDDPLRVLWDIEWTDIIYKSTLEIPQIFPSFYLMGWTPHGVNYNSNTLYIFCAPDKSNNQWATKINFQISTSIRFIHLTLFILWVMAFHKVILYIYSEWLFIPPTVKMDHKGWFVVRVCYVGY